MNELNTRDDWRQGCYFNRREHYTKEYQNITSIIRGNTFSDMILFLYMIHCKNFTMSHVKTNKRGDYLIIKINI
jgi:hypothetical protein